MLQQRSCLPQPLSTNSRVATALPSATPAPLFRENPQPPGGATDGTPGLPEAHYTMPS